MIHFIKMLLALAAVFFLISFVPNNTYAYTGDLRIPGEGVTQKITLEDGSTLVGKITEIRADQIKFQTDLGEMTIAVSKIKTVSEVSQKKEVKEVPEKKEAKEVKEIPEVKKVKETVATPAPSTTDRANWFPNPNLTRMMIGPTARTLKANEGYLYDLWIFFPGVAYGITDNLMISGGASVIPGADDQMFYIAPKYGFAASENLDLAANFLVFRLWDETFYLAMGNATLGSSDASLTGGLALAWTEHGAMDKPAGNIGGEYRFSRRTSLVGEAWFVPGEHESGLLGLGGIRLLGSDMTVDLGIAVSSSTDSEDNADWLPYFDFVYNF